MSECVLVVMAGGLGSRFGGLKQLEKFGHNGEKIIDYTVFDALRAGFSRVAFIIQQQHYTEFRREVGDNIARHAPVDYVFQSVENLPEGFSAADGRTKPLGTGHAVWCSREAVNGAPFAVVNADDYYGPQAFSLLTGFLKNADSGSRPAHYCMAGFALKNTLTENGSVSRGVCECSRDGLLTGICEHTRIEKTDGGPRSFAEDGSSIPLSPETVVSMNCWGFTPDFFEALDAGLKTFLADPAASGLKGEYYLPSAVDACLHAGSADVRVLHTPDRWYGVTYREDRDRVASALCALTDSGKYPEKLF